MKFIKETSTGLSLFQLTEEEMASLRDGVNLWKDLPDGEMKDAFRAYHCIVQGRNAEVLRHISIVIWDRPHRKVLW